MRVLVAAATFTAALSLLPPLAMSDGPSPVKEKRKPRPAKVYTEEDLRRAGHQQTSIAPAQAATAPAGDIQKKEGGAEKKEKTEDQLKAEEAKAWSERLQKAQGEVARLTKEIDQLQLALNDLTDWLYTPTRTAQLNKMDELKKQLAETRQQVEDLEEDGRRKRFR